MVVPPGLVVIEDVEMGSLVSAGVDRGLVVIIGLGSVERGLVVITGFGFMDVVD